MKYDYTGDYDGDLWQALVNKVMELEVLSDEGIFLIGSYCCLITNNPSPYS